MMLLTSIFTASVIWATTKAQNGLSKVNDRDWANGDNPTRLSMFLYAPPDLPPNSPIVVAIHFCGGSAAMYQPGVNFLPSAKQHNFAVIYPQATHDNNCWEVNTERTLTRGGKGDSDGIYKMINYTAAKYNSDSKRIFALGSSSGGMMTNVMAATYPDVIAAAASFSGIPYGCLAGSKGASPRSDNSPCVKGGVKKTGAQWAAMVKKASGGSFSGNYPAMQIWHQTGDPIVNFALENEQIKQWTAVHGISETPTSTQRGVPKAGTTKKIYGDGKKVVAFEVTGVGHPAPVNIPEVLKWFGIAN